MFTNSNWFAFEDDKAVSDRSAGSVASPSPNSEDADEVVVGESEDLVNRPTPSETSKSARKFPETGIVPLGNGSVDESKEDTGHSSPTNESDKSPEWVEWRETTDSTDLCCTNSAPIIPNGDIEAKEFNDFSAGKALPSEGDDDALPLSDDPNLGTISQSKFPDLASGIPTSAVEEDK